MLNALFDGPLSVAREMERLFEPMLASQPGTGPSGPWTLPALNLWEDDDRYVVEAELPGLSMDDVAVSVDDGELIIEGSRDVRTPDNARSLRRERVTTHFRRSLQLPATIDAGAAEATLADGVLTITMPKAEDSRPRRIEVKASTALPDNA